jgi:hypothetical protein
LEENASLIALKEDAGQTTTVIAHNGDDGQITRGKGALSFRIGDFFSGKDTEQMRLTAEGNVGIGIAHPLARLDVDGVIRATQGFVFPDGSVQFSAARRTFGAESLKPGQFGKDPSLGKQHLEQQESGTGTQNRLAKWLDNAGTLGDSAIVDVNGAIGIGTTTPQSGLDYRNAGAAIFARDLPANPGVAQSALQLGLSNLGSRNAGVGPSFLFFGENTAGAKSFLGRVSGVWENPSAGAEAGAIFFQVRANSSDVNALTERMRINSIGNVGIGTTGPAHRLSIFGGPNWTSDFWGGAIGLPNASAIGWQANASGFRYGIGHTTAGFAIFRTASDLGTTSSGPTYDFRIDNFGNIGIGNIGLATGLISKMEIFAQDGLRINGFQPFLTLHDTSGGNKSSFLQGVNGDAVLLTNSRAALVVQDVTGNVGIGTNTPGSKLSVVGGSSIGVFASSTGFAMYADGNVAQPVGASGFVKAMVLVNADGTINLCYNSQTTGSDATTPPCGGLSVSTPFANFYDITFPFQVNTRFLSATAASECCDNALFSGRPAQIGARAISFYTIRVQTKFEGVTGGGNAIPFYLIVF